ncbi:hypothetical protein [Rhizorhabdus argentea]|uniref:hypothetical protein n=1 Tax=Rhizorhabdus argentea TaxID=1387174 RepID=UPI0030EF0827
MSAEAVAISSRLPPLRLPDRRWQKWLSAAISLALLTAIASQLDKIGLTQLRNDLPKAPAFWCALGAYYLALPASEWLIYRRLWKLPAAGFAALLRKLVSNEVLLGYSGELAFYGWARARSGLSSAPFGAIKDVSVTSALAGNVATLVMIVTAWPYLGTLNLPMSRNELVGSIAAVLAITAAIGLLRGRIFSLPGRDLRFIMMMHLGRLAMTTLLSILLWHLGVPGIGISSLVVLGALQLLVTRLPLVPSKDLVFAATTILLVGGDSRIGALVALIAALVLATHLVVGAALAGADLLETAKTS